MPWSDWRFEVGGALFFNNTLRTNDTTFSALLVELSGCYGALRLGQAMRVWACGEGAWGPLRTRVSAEVPRDPVRTLVQLGAGPTLVWEWSEIVSFRVGVAAVFPLLRDTFYLSAASGRSEVFRVSPVIASGSLGLSAAIF